MPARVVRRPHERPAAAGIPRGTGSFGRSPTLRRLAGSVREAGLLQPPPRARTVTMAIVTHAAAATVITTPTRAMSRIEK